ncbi:PAS domain S-box-containing protein [Dyadobacter sp. SG02]|uniref:PAS domain-containing protein n=1 Tax=Dyadobacter sp. SG02 TaxID=1855291 RepID=UPI0008D77318|nr:PAS domain-containing protein [Dyadobacter sp. SG02]SEJ61390.1 PAS domain S-box-containing protein [Dyadobacter sp. SG02]
MINHYLSQVFKYLPAPSMVVLPDAPKFTITDVNDAYLDMVRLGRNELVGKGFYEAYPNNPYNLVSPWNNLLEKLVKDGLPNQSPAAKYILPPDDRGWQDVKYLLATNTPVRNEAGEIVCIVRTVTDVTELTLARQTHSPFTSEKFLNETLRIARVGSWEADLINQVITWSDVVKEIHEVPADYQPGYLTAIEFYRAGAHRDAFMEAVQNTIVTGKLLDLELIITTWTGREKWVRVTGKADIVEGVCTRIYGVIHDIHERKMVEQELVQSHRQFESLVQTVDGIVWEADAENFQFNFISDQVQHILGYTPEEWLADPAFWQNHIHPEDREQAVRYCHRETQGLRNHIFDYRMIKADGSLVWIKDVVSVIREGGKAVLLRGLMVDISEAKRLETLEHLEKVVLEMNSVKGTPLSSVLDRYVRGVEAMFPHSRCSLLGVKNKRLHSLASPSLPLEYVESINGLSIGEQAGSCGTAAFLKQQVIVSDIATDPRWECYRHLALPHDLLACWSYPIILNDEVVATFAVYYDRIAEPGEDELKVIERIAAILKVIFENRQNSELVQDVNERYEYVNMATNDAIYDWDLMRDHIEWGDGFFRIFGNEPDKKHYPLSRWAERVHPADRELIGKSLEVQLADPQQYKWAVEYRFRKSDGQYAFVEEIGYFRRNRAGKAIRMIGVLRDVTKAREEAHELKLLVSVITNTNDAVLIAESDPHDISGLKILYVNAAFTRITGYLPDEVVGKSPALLRGFSPARNDFDRLQDAIFNIEALKGATLRYARDGEEFFINLALLPVANARGVHTHWIAIGHDVTDRLRYISEIEERNHKLQEIAWMQSHVIRAPLARLMGLIDLIRNYQHSDTERNELLDHVLTSAYSLDEIIRDISSKTERI